MTGANGEGHGSGKSPWPILLLYLAVIMGLLVAGCVIAVRRQGDGRQDSRPSDERRLAVRSAAYSETSTDLRVPQPVCQQVAMPYQRIPRKTIMDQRTARGVSSQVRH